MNIPFGLAPIIYHFPVYWEVQMILPDKQICQTYAAFGLLLCITPKVLLQVLLLLFKAQSFFFFSSQGYCIHPIKYGGHDL